MSQHKDEGLPSDSSVHFSQTAEMQTLSLSQLREHVKQVMIPLLIQTFQHQVGKEAYDQLKLLDQDLEHLEHWVRHCRVQVAKAMGNTVAEPKAFSVKAFKQEDKPSWWRTLLGKK